jgi:hypothetical protein
MQAGWCPEGPGECAPAVVRILGIRHTSAVLALTDRSATRLPAVDHVAGRAIARESLPCELSEAVLRGIPLHQCLERLNFVSGRSGWFRSLLKAIHVPPRLAIDIAARVCESP